MSEYRRYRPRRNSPQGGGGWGRWFVVMIVIIAVLIVGKMMLGGKKSTTANTNSAARNNSGISLLTDNTNLAVANVNAANANSSSNTNSTTNSNTSVAAASSGSWQNYSVKSCPKAISNFGKTKQVVLTISLSAANDNTTKALDSLKTTGAPGDFFTFGAFAAKNLDLVKSVWQSGHAVYSQSYDSTDLTKLTDADVTSAITKTDAAIVAATGVSSKPIFRPPAGSYTAATLKLLNQQGYCAVLWTVDAYDWQDGMTAAGSKDRVMAALAMENTGSIVALHAGYDITPQLITDLVAELKTQGYEIVTLATLLNS